MGEFPCREGNLGRRKILADGKFGQTYAREAALSVMQTPQRSAELTANSD